MSCCFNRRRGREGALEDTRNGWKYRANGRKGSSRSGFFGVTVEKRAMTVISFDDFPKSQFCNLRGVDGKLDGDLFHVRIFIES